MSIYVSKKIGNNIISKTYVDENDFKKGKWISYSNHTIKDINFDKSYVDELYCRKICKNCYTFGASYDIRCNNDKKPINQVVNECPKFKNAIQVAKEMKEKMCSDNDFYSFCKFVNTLSVFKESDLEIFLGVFKKYL